MIDDDHDGTKAFHCTTEQSDALNGNADRVALTERRMRGVAAVSVIAVRLIEAACGACDGDREAPRGYVALATAFVHDRPNFEPGVRRGLFEVCEATADGGVYDGYDLLIRCQRTSTAHGLRMVFVDRGPQSLPLLGIVYRTRRRSGEPAPTNYRSLSRRQVGVLQMIARGMSNKCIAQSLGIAPETVKTHAKGILSKLGARTRAQAVARAEAIGLL